MTALSTTEPSTSEPRREAGASRFGEDFDTLAFLGGGESRSAPLTGVKALMLAVLEDGIRCYFSSTRLVRTEAEHWVESRHHKLVFSFEVICETFGIEAGAARARLRALRDQGKRAMPAVRTRPNVRHNTVAVLRKRRRRSRKQPTPK